MTAVNLDGSYHAAFACIPHLIAGNRGGVIIFTSSTAGLRGFGGVEWSRLCSIQARHRGTHAHTRERIGAVEHSCEHSASDCGQHDDGDKPGDDRVLGELSRGGPHLQNPMPVEMLEPEDISAAIAYLVSDEAKYVTGVTFPVDAGFCNKL